MPEEFKDPTWVNYVTLHKLASLYKLFIIDNIKVCIYDVPKKISV